MSPVIEGYKKTYNTQRMDPLKAKFQEKASALYAETKALLKEHGDKVVERIAAKSRRR